MTGFAEVLTLTESMPTRALAAGEVLVDEGDDGAEVIVLASGRLRVDLGGTALTEIATAGSFVGEVGALTGRARTATVVAVEPTVVRVIGDPATFFASHPDLGLELARQLAGRLQRLMAYLGDVKEQFRDADGHLGMIDAVLGRIASRPSIDIEPGSDRAPDY